MGEVFPDTRTRQNHPRNDYSVHSFEGFPKTGEDTKPPGHHPLVPQLSVSASKGLDATSWALVLPHSSSSRIEEEDASASNTAEPLVGQMLDGRRPSRQLGPQQSPGPGVVAGGPEPGAGSNLLQLAVPDLFLYTDASNVG